MKPQQASKEIYVGCYFASNGLNVFVESINSTQCRNGANAYSTLTCYIGGFTNFLDSESMTIEICIQVCINGNGFKYAGLNE